MLWKKDFRLKKGISTPNIKPDGGIKFTLQKWEMNRKSAERVSNGIFQKNTEL